MYLYFAAGNVGMKKLKAWLISSDYEAEDEESNAEQYELKRGRGQE